MAKIEEMIKSRGGVRSYIAAQFNKFIGLNDDQINIPFLRMLISDIKDRLDKLDQLDQSLIILLDPPRLDEEIKYSAEYNMDVKCKLSELCLKLNSLENEENPPPPSNPHKSVKLPLPPIHLDPFENNSNNPFGFYNFLKSFKNAIAGMPDLTCEQKFIYLKSYLKGEALNLVENIDVDVNGYDKSLLMLRSHFLNEDEIKDRTLELFININEVKNLSGVEELVREAHTKLNDLNSLGVDFLEEDSCGLLLVSKLLLKKLPRVFTLELKRVTGNNYPSFNLVLKNYKEILSRLSSQSENLKPSNDDKSVRPKFFKPFKQELTSKSDLSLKSKGYTNSSKPVPKLKYKHKCKFCAEEHMTSNCTVYNSLADRRKRAVELGLCELCLNQNHKINVCPGKRSSLPFRCFTCNKPEHHVALCPGETFQNPKGMMIIKSDSSIYMPVINIPLFCNNKSAVLPFLLDTGAEFSVINKEVAESFLGVCSSPMVLKPVSHFGQVAEYKRTFEYSVQLKFPSGGICAALFLAIENFNIGVRFPNIISAVANMEKAGIPVSPSFGIREQIVPIMGVVGNDILQFFSIFSFENALIAGNKVKVIRLSDGYIPYGSVNGYLESSIVSDNTVANDKSFCIPLRRQNRRNGKSKQIKPVYKSSNNNNKQNSVPSNYINFPNHPVLSSKFVPFPPKHLSFKQERTVNFVMNPIGSQYDPLEEIFPETNVEYGLDNFYKLESIGIQEEDSDTYVKDRLNHFKESAYCKDGHYYVNLPWNEDILKNVPSNLKIALAVADRVYHKLEIQGIDKAYENVFEKQEELGIIEPVKDRSSGQIYIPHRPVIKTDDLTTTKIRPVFNCSLKIGQSPSLNEAAFPGVNLMNNILSLLLYFRTNNYVVLADIMKAFLQIRLASDDDKNKFCFFRKIDGKFVLYRYNTIIFGFVTSPFILNFIVQCHLEQHSHVEAASLIKNKFYVDNLILTSNDLQSLSHTVSDSHSLMEEGGLPLREWTSNNSAALKFLSQEVCSDNSEAKVLGYIYDVNSDNMHLKNNILNYEARTKRQIWASLNSIFDPIGIFSPLLLRGKMVIRSLAILDKGWDQEVGCHVLDEWRKCCSEFNMCSKLTFKRSTFCSDSPVKLFLFADASKEAFGCTIYAVQGDSRSLLFAKTKVGPVRERTLPSLELLASLLALKCLVTIFDNGIFVNISLNSIVLFVDSQVVLSWILSNKAPRKNVFVNNRLKEISSLLDRIRIKYVPVSFAYIPSFHNEADLLTKPLTGKKFKERFDQWVSGPEWLTLPSSEWPKGHLGCIPHKIKEDLINTVVGMGDSPPAVDITKYSSFSKLLGVTCNVFKFAFKLRRKDIDCVEAATNYLIKIMQSDEFVVELDYLRDPSGLEAPRLVTQLDLFLDNNGVIRSRGRIDKNVDLKYHVVNPVLVARKHHLTRLLVYYAHTKSLHLGLQPTLNFLRTHGFWILKARQVVNSVLKECVVCKRYNVRGGKYPSPSSLPAERVNLSVPFAHTGVDYTGHIWILNEDGTKSKYYILIFTCFNTRALHLEAVHSMSTAEFILAFVRFVNRYGVPSSVYSDNAKSFIQAGGIIEQLLSSSEFEERFKISHVKHKTIPAYAAWYGSVWERLIRTVKQCLYKALGRTVPYFSQFVTLLSDVQKVLNNRPLTYRSQDNEIDIITPNHFLVGRPLPSLLFGNLEQLPEWDYCDRGEYSTSLQRTLEFRDSSLELFKEKWLKEYLVNLREKDRACAHSSRNWMPGEVVFFKLPLKTRPHWPLCQIVEVYPDTKGIIRTVKIRKANKGETVVNVGHLIPLELFSELNQPHSYIEDPASDLVEEEICSLSDNDSFYNGESGRVDQNECNGEGSFEELEAEVEGSRPTRQTARASRAQFKSLARRGLL